MSAEEAHMWVLTWYTFGMVGGILAAGLPTAALLVPDNRSKWYLWVLAITFWPVTIYSWWQLFTTLPPFNTLF